MTKARIEFSAVVVFISCVIAIMLIAVILATFRYGQWVEWPWETGRWKSPPVPMGWYTLSKQQEPQVMSDFCVTARIVRSISGESRWLANNADYSWDEFTNAVTKYVPAKQFSLATVVDAAGDVPVADVKRTIDLLLRHGHRYLLLFGRLECVDSLAMAMERQAMDRCKSEEIIER